MTYSPRRQSVRWLDADCPKEVLAIMDNGGMSFDRYTVFYVPDKHTKAETPHRGMWIGYRAMSEHPASAQGFGIYEEMEAYKVAEYRYRAKSTYAKWSDLPEDVKVVVRRDCKDIEEINSKPLGHQF